MLEKTKEKLTVLGLHSTHAQAGAARRRGLSRIALAYTLTKYGIGSSVYK